MYNLYPYAAGALALAAAFAANSGDSPASTPVEAPAGGASAAGGSSSSCINFAKAASFKTVDKDTIRLTVAGGSEFEIDLSGPQCSALDEAKGLAIESAPSFPVCQGPQNGKHKLRFSAEGRSEPIRCTLMAVRAVEAKPAAK